MKRKYDSELTERLYWLAKEEGILNSYETNNILYLLVDCSALTPDAEYAILRVTDNEVTAEFYDTVEALEEFEILTQEGL